ncbi:PLP-dependent aminotransferase family protein [Leeia sp.]|uniref:aminotransferase-like domain-containing protein n=1 Tax=Leeia sp. TaxID=2884678 RepID=UPI0035B01D74
MMLQLERDGSKRLGDQIVARMEALIRKGQLGEGKRLPSVRQLARTLDVSMHTVTTAFERLVAQGLVESRPGSGYYVARQLRMRPCPPIEMAPVDPATAAGFAQYCLSSSLSVDVPVGSGFLPGEWQDGVFQGSSLQRLLRAGSGGMDSAPVQGSPQLRERIAERLVRQGIPAMAGNLLLTAGASHAFDLVIRTALNPGDVVMVEDPGYFVMHQQLQRHGVRMISVPRLADGPDVERLAELAMIHRPRMFYTQTLLHNPTGGNTSPAVCHKLLNLAERYNFLILEDDVYGELAGPHALRLAKIDEFNRVLYISSFTKVLNPGMRIGYVAAPTPLLPALMERKMFGVLTGSSLQEMLVDEVMASGRYHRHTEQLRNRLTRVRSQAIATLSGLSLQVEDAVPDGIFLWVKLPDGLDSQRLAQQALAERILLASGAIFSLTGGSLHHLRLNVAYAAHPRFIAFLQRALQEGGSR